MDSALVQYLRYVAQEAYAYGCGIATDDHGRGYAAGVEDLARYLLTPDSAVSDRLVAILRAAETGRADDLTR